MSPLHCSNINPGSLSEKRRAQSPITRTQAVVAASFSFSTGTLTKQIMVRMSNNHTNLSHPFTKNTSQKEEECVGRGLHNPSVAFSLKRI